MSAQLAKTDAGQNEIRSRTLALSRASRTLLVLADGSRSAAQLLEMVKGSSQADLGALLDAGLIAEVASRRKDDPAVQSPATSAAAAAVSESVSELGYQELYDCLNALCKEQLGLMRGFKYALEIEKAGGIEGLREVAGRFVLDVQRVKGDAAAQMVRRALGINA